MATSRSRGPWFALGRLVRRLRPPLLEPEDIRDSIEYHQIINEFMASYPGRTLTAADLNWLEAAASTRKAANTFNSIR